MTISCPKCGSNNISTAGVCANCGWSLFARCVTSSDVYNPIGDMEFEAAGKALLNDYKRLLIENNSLAARIAELEEKQRWIPVGERLPKEEGWYYAGVLGRFGDHYTHDVYFYAEDAAFRWKDCEGDKVYCWLDGVPALPTPPEVQE